MRFLPAAITPVRFADVARAAVAVKGGLPEFESRLASYFRRKNAYTFSSLMRTTYACFVALSVGSKRRKVVLPRYSCPSFAHGVLAAGLEIEYCDVDPTTLSIDIESLSRIALDDVLAVVCANLFGLTSAVDQIIERCHPKGALVIEGVDYGIGTEYRGRRIGTWGDVAILNFQEGKALPVGGGAVVSDLPAFSGLFSGVRQSMSPNFLTMTAFSIFSHPTMYSLLMGTMNLLGINRKTLSMEDTIRKTKAEMDFTFNPSSYHKAISAFQGRLGCMLLDRLEDDLRRRRSNANALTAAILEIPGVTVIREIAGVNKVHFIRLPTLIAHGKRNQVLAELLNAGIEASPMYVEHGLRIDGRQFPGAARIATELMTLPCHPYVTRNDIDLTAGILSGNHRTGN